MAITNATTLADYAAGISTQNATLKVDSGNKRVGIGTTNPKQTLQVGTAVSVYGTTGIVSATAFYGDGSGLTGVASTDNINTGTAATFTGNVNISGITTVGILTAYDSLTVSVWTLGADGTSHYTFTGPGDLSDENDPDLQLIRGQRYIFENRSGGHPFRIQSTVNGSTGTAYNDGVSNNDAGNGTDLVFDVPFDAPSVLYYQCTSHGNMGGVLYIGSSSGDDIKVGVGATIHASSGNAVFAGVVTATSFSGTSSLASGLTGTPDITVRNVTGVAATFTGVLTYEDVTNVDAVGVITARGGIEIGASGVGGTISPGGNVKFTGITTVGAGLSFADDIKAKFGAGGDLSIYHDGSNSYIKDLGTGDLKIQGASDVVIEDTSGSNSAVFNTDGSVELYYRGASAGKKLETTTSGVIVTGVTTSTEFVGGGSGLTGISVPAGFTELDAALFN